MTWKSGLINCQKDKGYPIYGWIQLWGIKLSIYYKGSQKDSPSSPQDSLEIQEFHHKIICKLKMYGNAQ